MSNSCVYICGTEKIKMEVGARAYRAGNVAPPLRTSIACASTNFSLSFHNMV